MFKTRYATMLAGTIALGAWAMAAGLVGAAADAGGSRQERERKLIDVVKSGSGPQDKAIACKQLAIYGGKDAVPALAALLPDKELSSWARIALEAIPDSAADDALREAMGKVQGRLLIGVINSIGYRRDAKAVGGLVQRLKDAEAAVASAAAVALGKIGGAEAGKALERFLAAAPTVVRPAVAEGCIVCAEGFLANGNRDAAVKLYDAVRKADVPKQRLLEAIRGAILARGTAGVPLLLEQLRSPEKATFAIGLRTARELAGAEATEALVAELGKAEAERQGLLILAIADRGDAKALPAILAAAKSGPTSARIAACSVLEQLGDASCVPVLLEAATSDDAELVQAGKTSLARLSGKQVDADLFAALQQSAGKKRQVLIELVEQRRIDGSIPVFVKFAEDADAGVRSAALVAIGALGDDKQLADLAKLLGKAQGPKDRADIEKAMLGISSRCGVVCVPHLLPLAHSAEGADRIVGLHALACCGGPEALGAIMTALGDKDEAVVDESVRTLSTWPNRWPEDGAVTDPLAALAKSGKKAQHQVLAVRGYLQYVQEARKLTTDARLAKVNQILPLIARAEEKRLAISVLSAIGTGGAMQPLVTYSADPAIAEEACSAIVSLAGKNVPGLSREQRQTALQAVVERAKADATRMKAEAMLKE